MASTFTKYHNSTKRLYQKRYISNGPVTNLYNFSCNPGDETLSNSMEAAPERNA